MTFPASSSAAAAVVFAVPLVALVRNKKKKPERQVPADREVLQLPCLYRLCCWLLYQSSFCQCDRTNNYTTVCQNSGMKHDNTGASRFVRHIAAQVLSRLIHTCGDVHCHHGSVGQLWAESSLSIRPNLYLLKRRMELVSLASESSSIYSVPENDLFDGLHREWTAEPHPTTLVADDNDRAHRWRRWRRWNCKTRTEQQSSQEWLGFNNQTYQRACDRSAGQEAWLCIITAVTAIYHMWHWLMNHIPQFISFRFLPFSTLMRLHTGVAAMQ